MTDDTSKAITAYRKAVAAFDSVVKEMDHSSWDAPTPCTEWTVRQLMNHVVAEDVWAQPLLAGRSVEDVANEIPDDALGDDPHGAWAAASSAALAATDDPGLPGRTIQLSGREASPAQYLMEMATDHAAHAWDLSAALGEPTTLPADLVSTIAAWFTPQAEMWRQAPGVLGPEVPVEPGADPQTALLGGLGRDASWRPPA